MIEVSIYRGKKLGTQVVELDISTGTRIAFKGDVANQPGRGAVAAVKTSRWGTDLMVQLEDGRTWWLTPTAFIDSNASARWTVVA